MRLPLRILLVLAVVTAGAVLFRGWRRPGPPPRAASVFHPSDVALLASTGRPQLVEFFHHA